MGTEVVLYAMLTVGATDSALLDAGMEALYSLEVEAVDISLAKFEFTDTTGCIVNIVGEDRRSQSIFAIVSPGDNLIKVVPHYDWEHRTKGLLMSNIHVLTTVIEQSSCIEIALLPYSMATTKYLCALFYSLRYLGLYTFECTSLHEWTHVDIIS